MLAHRYHIIFTVVSSPPEEAENKLEMKSVKPFEMCVFFFVYERKNTGSAEQIEIEQEKNAVIIIYCSSYSCEEGRTGGL